LSANPAACLSRGAEVLRRGALCAFPTETVYGLGADALVADAVEAIYLAKGRPQGNPLIVHVADVDGARRVVRRWPEAAARLAARFWPGPLTLVLPRADGVPDITTAGLDSVAVRMPAHAFARELIEASGGAVAAPSANRSTAVSPTTAQHVLDELDGQIDLLIDGGPTTVGIESSVVSLLDQPRLLRPGDVSRAQLEAVLGELAGPADEGPARSPGMMSRHYAPRAAVQLLDADAVKAGAGPDVAALVHSASPSGYADVVRLPRDARAYARGLYAALRELDARVDRIVIEEVPEDEAWAAVRDRLARAAR